MLYYYNRDGKFQKESSKEYKTEKGAVEKLQKEGKGAVFDETGQTVLSIMDKEDDPERDIDTNEDNEQVGVADAEATEEDANGQEKPGEERQENEESEGAEQPDSSFDVQTTCDVLRIRAKASADSQVIGKIKERAGSKKKYTIVAVKNGWGRLKSGAGWISLAYTKKVS